MTAGDHPGCVVPRRPYVSSILALTASLLVVVAGAAPPSTLAAAGAQPQPAHAGLVVLTDARIGPYRDTAAGARRSGEALREVDVRTDAAVRALAASRPAVVLAIGQQALQVAMRELPGTPVVFANVLVPQQYRLPAHVTGVPLEADPAQQLRVLREMLPRLRRIGVIDNPATFGPLVAEIRRVAQPLNISVVEAPASSVRQVQALVRPILQRSDALLLLPDPGLWSRDTLSYTLLQGIQQGRPVIGFLDSVTQSGALASFAPDYRAIGLRSRELADAILAATRSGTAPRLPPIRYAPGRLSLNLATAGRLRITMPSGFERRAGRVFR